METFDLGIAWDREEDNEFVEGLNNYALKEGLRPYLLHGDIKYIAQEKINPVNLENRPAWFRVFYCLGKINPCWWNPLTRNYDILTIKEIYRFGLYDMWRITKMIHTVSSLDFFSAEMAMRSNEKFIVVDYVNGQPDMRKKSKFNGGLPDEIVDKIIGDIIAFVKQKQGKAKK